MRTTLALLSLLVAGVAGARIVSDTDLQSTVSVENVGIDAGTVSGELVNHSNDTLENVRLLFEDRFLWHDEFHPGANEPGGSTVFTVDRVPPRSRVRFRFDRPARPERTDGRFESSVRVLGFTAQETPAAGSFAQPAGDSPVDSPSDRPR